MIWTLISAVMSSLLYQLSYNLDSLLLINMRTKDLHLYILDMSQLCYYYINPQLLELCKKIYFIYNNINQLYMSNIASEGIEPSHVMMKTLCLNHLTIRPIIKKIFFIRSPVQVSHLLQLVTKQLHYFYANRTNG